MKKASAPASALLIVAVFLAIGATTKAGSIGPGPWANGAYYPEQFDGIYSASMFGGSTAVVSGVLGFGLDNGSPSTTTNSTTTTGGGTNSTATTITVNRFQNYFVTFIDGRTYAGATIANINSQTDQVTGGLFNGVAESSGTDANTASGGFVASLTGKKDIITFSGNNTGTVQTATNGVPVDPLITFSLNGMKVGY